MSDEVNELELEYWSAWRVKWLPRLLTLVIAVALALVAQCNWPQPKHVDPPAVALHQRYPANRDGDAQVMAQVCHAWLRRAKTTADTDHSLNFVHPGPRAESGEYYCLNWMVFAGEKP